jgi:NAD(P)-dependent dehydrogenase (short-subunit alcohol dehydrogenase family)
MMKTVVILSVSSDIGAHMATRYLEQGYRVIGTHRSKANLSSLESFPEFYPVKCDVAKPADLKKLVAKVKSLKNSWDIFVSCVGHPLPVVPFFESNFDEWQKSVHVNSIAQLQALHMLYPLRNTKGADVVYFAGGGMNGAVVNFSAYTISKIMLAKMCEFLDAENHDLNIFIVGPGWTKTKIHDTILKDKRTASVKVKETKAFLKEKQGTSIDEIFECIDWLCAQGKGVASGRNFSVVYDPWRVDSRSKLVKALNSDKDMYKLRRHGN